MAAPGPNGPSNRLDYIDTLRGLAAFYVLLYHMSLLPAPPLSVPTSIAWLVLTGGTGVTLFFVVSAFTLCLSMHSHAGEPDALHRYFIRRAFRILPLFYVWVGLSWLRDVVMFGVYQSPGRVLLNLIFAYNFVPGEETSFVWAGWTLGVEMIFYLIFPAMFLYVTTVTRAALCVGATVALATVFQRVAGPLLAEGVRSSYLHFSFFHMLPVFVFGILAYRVHERFLANRPRRPLLSLALVGLACGGYWALLSNLLWSQLDALYWQAIIYATLVLGLSIVPWPLIVNRVTVFLGTISYSLYLNHPTIVVLLVPIYRQIYATPLPLAVKFAACAILTAGAVVAVSAVSYRLIEQPGIRYGGRIIRRSATLKPAFPGVQGH